jgi:glycosyltransferase involved in cell wall biosynthesis
MKILLAVTGVFHLGGGIAKVNRLMVEACCSMGHDLDIFALCEGNDLAPGYSNCIKNYLSFRGQKFRFTGAVWEKIFREPYDLIIFDHINLASLLAPLRIIKRVKYAVWIHGSEIVYPYPNFEGKLGLRFASKRLANSEYTKKLVNKIFPGLDVRACPLALDSELMRKIEIAQQSQSTAPINLTAIDGSTQKIGSQAILCVGRMDSQQRYKGQDILLYSFQEIVSKYPMVQLILVGSGDDYGYFKSIAKSLPEKIHSNLFMPGYVDDDLLIQLYKTCYMFALPSKGEGFGLVFLEAMALGKPCLSGGLDGSSCVVEDLATGLVIKNPDSVDQVRENILRLLENPGFAQQLGKNGQDRVIEKYSPGKFSERFWNILLN